MGNQLAAAKDRLFHHSRRRRRQPDVEFSEAEIRRKFDRVPHLSFEEKIVLKSSWKVIKRKVKLVGLHTFLELFKAYPDSQDVFPKFQGQALVQLEESGVLEAYGVKVMSVLDKVVANLDSKERVWDILIQLGRNHFNFGALPLYFDLVGPHFVIAVRNGIGNEWYEALEYHWLAFFNFVMYIMKFGWNLQRAEEQQKARNMSTK